MTDAIALRGVSKSFGGFKALDGVDFTARAGEVHALLGENGAGKSTLMNIAAGLYAPDEGRIEIGGSGVRLTSAREAAAHGVGMVHQHFKLVRAFSVLENISLFNPGRSAGDIAAQAGDLARRMGFDVALSRRVGDLSIAEQHRIEILKVLVAGARILILDEPTAVLGEAEGRVLMGLMRGLAEADRAVILVTHKLHEALGHSDRITVMRGGRKVAEARPADLDPARLTTLIVGQHIVEQPSLSKAVGAPRLRLDDVRRSGEDGRQGLAGVSFEVRGGEIYGVAGVSGNGQNQLADVIVGLTQPEAGQVDLDAGAGLRVAPPLRERRARLAFIPVDRYRHALAGGVGVMDNYAVKGTLAGRYGSWFHFDRKAARAATRNAIEVFDVRGARGPSQRAALLSGGNAQKLVIAREFADEPAVVLAHSPSRGLDVRATKAVHDRLKDARDRGAAVILMSEDLDEILLLADRIGVLSGGRIAAEFAAPADRSAIGAAMVSHEAAT
jgi:simple sugar transport system ATP-binding protein